MRFLSALLGDVRYQVKYGFYLLYAFFSAVYIAALFFCPPEYRKVAASIIVLTDPALLGSFFIGGIWLLEQGEGLHDFWGISPLRPIEYILSKALSLALISTVSAILIAGIGTRQAVNFAVLSMGVFVGAMIFTVMGLIVASFARSVNHYMLLISPLAVIVAAPPILAVFGLGRPVFHLLPGMALWNVLRSALGMVEAGRLFSFLMLAVWLVLAVLVAVKRISSALSMGMGEKA